MLVVRAFCLKVMCGAMLIIAAQISPSFAQSSLNLGLPSTANSTNPNAVIDGIAAKLFYESCSGVLPVGFTPRTRNDFCTCASVTAANIGMTGGELAAATGPKQKNSGYYNAALIKYVEGVVVPCMEEPLRKLTYVNCLEAGGHDYRIRSFPQYCTCSGDRAAEFLVARGAPDIVSHYSTFEVDPERDIIESFLDSPVYNTYLKKGMGDCIQPAFMQWRQ